MKLAITALLAGSASSFAPVAQKASSTTINMAFEDKLRVQAAPAVHAPAHQSYRCSP